jgi:hypothetical protein
MIKYFGKQVKNIKGTKEVVAYVFGKKNGAEKIALGVDCKEHAEILKLISCIKRKKISKLLPTDAYVDYLNFEQISNPTEYYARKYPNLIVDNYAPKAAADVKKQTKKLFNVLTLTTKTNPQIRVKNACKEIYKIVSHPTGSYFSEMSKQLVLHDIVIALLTADVAQYMYL